MTYVISAGRVADLKQSGRRRAEHALFCIGDLVYCFFEAH